MGSTHVIYHHADYDGLLSAAVCLHFMPDAVIHGWDYGSPVPEIPEDCERLYIVDLSVPEFMDDPRLVWIDHHKSAIEKWGNAAMAQKARDLGIEDFEDFRKGMRIDGVAACRLCWCYLNDPQREHIRGGGLSAEYFIRRLLKEPLVLTLAGEYDIWFEEGNPEWADCVALQHGLRLFSNDPAQLKELLANNVRKNGACADDYVRSLIERGADIELYQSEQNASILKYNSYVREWEGIRFLVLNSARGNSRSFPGTENRNDVDALCMWKYCGDGVTVSLYHKPGRKDLDLSEIAVKYGGGGHRGACGFKMSLDEFSRVLT